MALGQIWKFIVSLVYIGVPQYNTSYIFLQSRNPDGYPASRAYFQSRISTPFRFEIPSPGLQIREIPHLEKTY